MSETKSSESAKIVPAAKSGGGPFPLTTTRRALTIGGVALVAVNLVATMSGGLRLAGTALSALLWGAAAVCFLASFVVYLLEPVARGETPNAKPTDAGNPQQSPDLTP